MALLKIATLTVIALGVFALDAQARVSNQQIRQCTDRSVAPQQRVESCTLVIREGRLDAHNLAIAYTSRGNAYWALHDGLNAVADYDAAATMDASYAPAVLGRATVFLDRHNYERAIAEYNVALQMNPQLLDGYVNRGLAHYLTGDLDGALADFNHAATLQPEMGVIYDFRASIFLSMRRYDEALSDFDHAVSLAPDEPYFLTDACRLRAGLLNREIDRARTECERAVTLGGADARLARGLVNLRQNRFQDAWNDFDAAQTAEPAPLNLFARGVAAASLNRGTEARTDMANALSLDPGVADRWSLEFHMPADAGALSAARALRRNAAPDATTATAPSDVDEGEDVIVRPAEVDPRDVPVCRQEVVTGTVIRQSVCTTQREDERNSQRGQELLERLQRFFENSRMTRPSVGG